jgi:hypothetical protein
LRMLKLMSVAAVLILGSSIVRADGLTDARVGVTGGGGASGNCTSFQLTADGGGNIVPGTNTECKVTGVNATSITFAVPVGQTGSGPGLQVYSPLLGSLPPSLPSWLQSWVSEFVWTEICPSTPVAAGGTSVFECTLTAPTMPTDGFSKLMMADLTSLGIMGDGDCDKNDFLFYIPVGCDIKFTTGAIGNLPGDTSSQLLSGGAQLDSNVNGNGNFIPFAEPSALSLLLVGFAGLPLLRRRLVR